MIRLLFATAISWKALAGGVDYAAIPLEPKPEVGDGLLQVVRVDPARAKLKAMLAADHGGKSRKAAEWCDEEKLLAVINLGMFDPDGGHTGYLRSGEEVRSARWVKSYQSVLLVGAKKAGLPAATIRDAAPDATGEDFADYELVVQNLRLIREPGQGVWGESARKWSEAALALDKEGRILFLFCRSPFTMKDLSELLLKLPLGVVRAQHLEGGPEVSLSIRAKDLKLDLSGSYETGFHEDDSNTGQWAIPNVLGVVAGP